MHLGHISKERTVFIFVHPVLIRSANILNDLRCVANFIVIERLGRISEISNFKLVIKL